jgi:hypothetical protein
MRDLSNYDFRTKMGRLANECTRDIWCDTASAKRKWDAVINYVEGSK